MDLQDSESNLFRGLELRCIGPHRGGRVVAVAGDVNNPATFYFGACAGGVWKTTDAGTYWENLSDGYFTTAAIGALAVSESDPNVIYAGTGETAIRGNVSHGDGVYKSTDAGKTWRNMGLTDTRHIGRIRIHPNDPNLVYVAALGHAWGPNSERGVYRSRDGGETWDHILYRSDCAGAVDLSMDASNPRILYTTLWEAQRYPWALSSGGPGSGIFRSTDGGDTWTDLTRNPGLPGGVLGKIGIAASPARPGRVWALVEAHDGALFRSDDGGDTWQRLSEDGELRKRAWYYMHIFADPLDPDTCWVLNLQCWKSTDGGSTFVPIPTPHGDNHDLWLDPRNPRRMIEGNDGGACVSHNGGASWSTIYNQPTAQMYHVTTDTRIPYRVYGSQQDNSAISLPSTSIQGAITQTEWFVPGGGESGYIAVRPDDPNIIYAGAIGSGDGNGRMTRFDGHIHAQRNITVWPDTRAWADGADTLKYRFQWTFPISISPHDSQALYVGANKLLRSTDEGTSWEEVSPDLTRNDPSKLVASGGPITKDNTGAEVYCTIFAFVESSLERGLFWAGTDDGKVHLSHDAGATWNEITPPDLPEWALISVIEASPHDPATAHIAATRYKLDDTAPYLYKTNDYGATWQKITTGIPNGEFTRVIREDPVRKGLLFAGTETGIYLSFDDGANWQRFTTNLPAVPIYDFVVKNDDLVVATHGRSFWILDDITPLRHMAEFRAPADTTLFEPRPTARLVIFQGYGYRPTDVVGYRHAGPVNYAYRQRTTPEGREERMLLDAGANPPYGALFTYFLREEPKGEITLTITDATGNEVRRYSSKPAPAPVEDPHTAREPMDVTAEGMEAAPNVEPEGDEERREWLGKQPGIQRFAWDLRYEPAEKLPNDKSIEGFPTGPLVAPGTYRATLRCGDSESSVDVEVMQDPRSETPREDLEAMTTLLLRIRDKLTETHRTVKSIWDVRAQIDVWEKHAPNGEPGEKIRTSAAALKRELESIETRLFQRQGNSPLRFPSSLAMRLAALPGYGEGADAAPTAGMIGVFDDLSQQIDEHIERVHRLFEWDLAAFNTLVKDSGLPPVSVMDPTEIRQ